MSEARRHTQLLGVDYGRRRLGLAVYDRELGFPMPLPELRWEPGAPLETVLQALLAIAEARNVQGIVLGLPLNLDGRAGTLARAARAFATALSRGCELAVYLVDERLSTERARQQTELLGLSQRSAQDSLAAKVLLERYLDGAPCELV